MKSPRSSWVRYGIAALAFAAGIGTQEYLQRSAAPQPPVARMAAAATAPALPAAITQSLATPLRKTDKTTASLSQWKGRVLVINFWATWCAPCKKEIPDLITLRQQWLNQNVEFIGVAVDFPDEVQAFMKTTPISYPILLAPDEGIELMRAFGNTHGALPFTVVVDARQQHYETILGTVQPEDLAGRLQRLTARN